MDASEGVLKLRQRLGLSREELAQRIGVSAKMVQRLEGGQQPAARVLLTLAAIAKAAGFQVLADLFENTRRANMEARVEAVRRTARARRIALADLKYWSGSLHETANDINESLSQDAQFPDRQAAHQRLVATLQNAWHVMEHVRDEIEIPIAEAGEPYSSERLQQDKQVFHRPKRGSQNAQTKTRKR